MHWHNRGGTRTDGRRKGEGIHAACCRIDVNESRNTAGFLDGNCRRHCGQGDSDHLISFRQPGGGQRESDCVGARAHADGVAYTQKRSKLSLESFRFRAKDE